MSAATAMGILAIAVMVAWSPYALELNSQTYQRQASLQDDLRTVALGLGVPWFQTASLTGLCNTLSDESNATLVISAVVDGRPCAPRPDGVLFSANLTIFAGLRTVNLEAWQVGTQ